jgi:hypothetical protein
MAVVTGRGTRRSASDEADAFVRVVLGLSLGVGGMAAALGAATGSPILLVALPTAILLGARVLGSDSVAGWAGAAVWVALLPPAHEEAMLGPLAMIVLCVAVALGPERLLAWASDQLLARRGGEPAVPRPRRTPVGWIEEDGRPVD